MSAQLRGKGVLPQGSSQNDKLHRRGSSPSPTKTLQPIVHTASSALQQAQKYVHPEDDDLLQIQSQLERIQSKAEANNNKWATSTELIKGENARLHRILENNRRMLGSDAEDSQSDSDEGSMCTEEGINVAQKRQDRKETDEVGSSKTSNNTNTDVKLSPDPMKKLATLLNLMPDVRDDQMSPTKEAVHEAGARSIKTDEFQLTAQTVPVPERPGYPVEDEGHDQIELDVPTAIDHLSAANSVLSLLKDSTSTVLQDDDIQGSKSDLAAQKEVERQKRRKHLANRNEFSVGSRLRHDPLADLAAGNSLAGGSVDVEAVIQEVQKSISVVKGLGKKLRNEKATSAELAILKAEISRENEDFLKLAVDSAQTSVSKPSTSSTTESSSRKYKKAKVDHEAIDSNDGQEDLEALESPVVPQPGFQKYQKPTVEDESDIENVGHEDMETLKSPVVLRPSFQKYQKPTVEDESDIENVGHDDMEALKSSMVSESSSQKYQKAKVEDESDIENVGQEDWEALKSPMTSRADVPPPLFIRKKKKTAANHKEAKVQLESLKHADIRSLPIRRVTNGRYDDRIEPWLFEDGQPVMHYHQAIALAKAGIDRAKYKPSGGDIPHERPGTASSGIGDDPLFDGLDVFAGILPPLRYLDLKALSLKPKNPSIEQREQELREINEDAEIFKKQMGIRLRKNRETQKARAEEDLSPAGLKEFVKRMNTDGVRLRKDLELRANQFRLLARAGRRYDRGETNLPGRGETAQEHLMLDECDEAEQIRRAGYIRKRLANIEANAAGPSSSLQRRQMQEIICTSIQKEDEKNAIMAAFAARMSCHSRPDPRFNPVTGHSRSIDGADKCAPLTESAGPSQGASVKSSMAEGQERRNVDTIEEQIRKQQESREKQESDKRRLIAERELEKEAKNTITCAGNGNGTNKSKKQGKRRKPRHKR